MSFIPPLYISFTRTSEDPSSGLKPCEQQQRHAQAQHTYPGSRMHIPQCDEQGHFLPLQCHGMTGFCWCVDPDGHEVPGTQTAPGSLPPRCGPPGEKLGKRASSGLSHGLEKQTGGDWGADDHPCPDRADARPRAQFHPVEASSSWEPWNGLCTPACTFVTGTDIGTYVITAAPWAAASHLPRTGLEVETECVGQAEAIPLHLLWHLWEHLEQEDLARPAFHPKENLPSRIPLYPFTPLAELQRTV